MMQHTACLSDEQVEHLALGAAEQGDADTEQLCDRALGAGHGRNGARADLLADLLAYDGDLNDRYAEWMELGERDGYRKRAVVA